MRYENSIKTSTVKRKDNLQPGIERGSKGFQSREKKLFHKRGDRKIPEAKSYIEVRYSNSILDIIVNVRNIELGELIELLKNKLPDVEKVLGKNLKIRGRFPYQIGFWIAKRYYKLASSISVFDPVTKEYVRIF